jgi:hypothetical protein
MARGAGARRRGWGDSRMKGKRRWRRRALEGWAVGIHENQFGRRRWRCEFWRRETAGRISIPPSCVLTEASDLQQRRNILQLAHLRDSLR